MSTLDKLNDDELVTQTHKLASSLSYYNAAEGDSWRDEETARDKCLADFKAAIKEMRQRGLAFENKNYLIARTCYADDDL